MINAKDSLKSAERRLVIALCLAMSTTVLGCASVPALPSKHPDVEERIEKVEEKMREVENRDNEEEHDDESANAGGR